MNFICERCGKKITSEELVAHEEYHKAEDKKREEREAVEAAAIHEINKLYKELTTKIDEYNKNFNGTYRVHITNALAIDLRDFFN